MEADTVSIFYNPETGEFILTSHPASMSWILEMGEEYEGDVYEKTEDGSLIELWDGDLRELRNRKKD